MSLISSLVRIRKIHHLRLRCSFVWSQLVLSKIVVYNGVKVLRHSVKMYSVEYISLLESMCMSSVLLTITKPLKKTS